MNTSEGNEEKEVWHDYAKLGFKAGLEIHQQLDTGKLFCRCPGILRKEEPDFIVKRKLHAVPGESGEVDIAVQHEALLGKTFLYQGYNNTTCLVELDESPPEMINENALDEAIKIALLLNCELYPIVQIMRKTVIDGSNTSGFQRSVLIGHSGFIETSFGKVMIESVALEEDSARIIENKEKETMYRLDRLGIPLVEIGSAPDLTNSGQIKEAALKIGEILRVCKVKRGIGTIRQDINVSIKGHERVEIKGFQEPSMMVVTAEKEIERQMKDIEKGKKEGEVRGALENGETKFLRPMPGAARMYPETDLPLLKIGREKINEIKNKLPKLKHDIKKELEKKGLRGELLNLVLRGDIDEFETLLKVNKNAELVAKMTCLWRNEIATKVKKSSDEVLELLNEGVLEKILGKVNEGKIEEGDVKQIMIKIASGEGIDTALEVTKISDDEVESEIIQLVREKPEMREGAYMGMLIEKLGKDIDKRKAMEILGRVLKKE